MKSDLSVKLFIRAFSLVDRRLGVEAGGGALRLRYRRLTKSKAMSNPVKIVAMLTALPGQADALRNLLEGMVAASRQEAGALRYDLWQDQAHPARFVLDELYVDAAALAAHRASPHFQHYVSVIGGLAERTALELQAVAVA